MWMDVEAVAVALDFPKAGALALTEVQDGPLRLQWRKSGEGLEFLAAEVSRLGKALNPRRPSIGFRTGLGRLVDTEDESGLRLSERRRPSARGRRRPRASVLQHDQDDD